MPPRPSPSPPELPVLVRLAALLTLVPLLIVGAGTLVGAGIAPAAPIASDLVQTVSDDVLGGIPPFAADTSAQDERSVVVDAAGNELAVLRAVNRKLITLDQVPTDVQNAVLATEDATFREHRGVNWQAIVRAAVGNLRAGEVTSGASTITQQLVKNLTDEDETTLQRKVREAVYAVQLERQLSKDRILELYLNEAYLANGVYGLGTAAEFYFSKSVESLSIPEAALLAGMLRAPEVNDPIDNPQAARARRDIVLEQMVEAGFIASIEADIYSAEPVTLNLSPLPETQEPFFVSYVRSLLRDLPELGADPATRERFVLTGGLTIETTLDPAVQSLAEEAITGVLGNPDGPQAALTAIEPDTGRILAIGFGPKKFGTGPGETEVLPAVPGVGSSFGRQPGSSFKAFELVAALEDGVSPTYTTSTPSPYVPTRFCADSGWRPGNYSDGGGGTLDLAAATARSSNVYFAHLVDQFTGPDSLAETARRMGIVNTDLDPAVCAMVLGSREVYPLDMASAFGTLANRGTHCEPFAIERILGRDGRVLYEGGGRCVRAVEESVATQATSFLRGPIENGTATRNGQIGRPAAGKTGTTQEWKDAWFVGYIPQLSTAVWVGHEQPRTMTDPRCGNVTGGCLPAMIWSQFMRDTIAAKRYPLADFPPPARVPSDVVPSVVGHAQEDAEAALVEAGFAPTVETVTDWRPAGIVVRQNPAAGASAPTGSQILLEVSDGTGERPRVPSVVGRTAEDAAAAVRAAGLVPRISEVPVDDPAEVGIVVGQSPRAGQLVSDVPDPEPGSPSGAEVVIAVGRARTTDDGPAPSAPSPSPSPGTATGAPAPDGADPPPPPPEEQPSPVPPPGDAPSPAPTLPAPPEPSPRASDSTG